MATTPDNADEYGAEATRLIGLLRSGVESIRTTLRRDLEGAWTALRQVLSAQQAGIAAVAAREPDSRSVVTHRSDAADSVLVKPLGLWDQERPLQRAQDAVERAGRGLDELVRRAPDLTTSGPGLLAAITSPAGGGLTYWVAGRRSRAWSVPLSRVVAQTIASLEPRLLHVEGRILAAFAQGPHHLVGGWATVRSQIDAAALGTAPNELVTSPETPDPVDPLDGNSPPYLDELDSWFATLVSVCERNLVASLAWRRTPRPVQLGWAPFLERWSDQAALLEAELRFERRLDQVERGLTGLGGRLVAELEAERADLRAATDTLASWLDHELAASSDGGMTTPPEPEMTILPAAARADDAVAELARIAGALPHELHLLSRIESSPPPRRRTKPVAPDRIVRESFRRTALPALRAILDGVQTEHIGLVQRVDRARQVVAFATERTDQVDDPSVTREARENARSLLAADQDALAGPLTTQRQAITRAILAAAQEARLLLTRGQFGTFAYLGRTGIRRGTTAGFDAAIPALRAGFAATIAGAGSLYRRFLIAIQWAPESESSSVGIVRRPYLPREFTADPRDKPLPAIYRRLFRFDAVDDPRFLVGRDREMQALAEARLQWESGRPVAALVVGERGSGKTSLINCALRGPLHGLPTCRGEFRERISTAADVRQFIADLVGASDPDALIPALLAERRVVVIEETERAFIREIGGFDGMRELERIIAATSPTTFWLVVTNQNAFRLLNAAVKLGDTFSHRLDAATAPAAAVREAILIRHNLSGLRLRFLPPPRDPSWRGRLRGRVGSDPDPEATFFDALARESAGVFRTAFELWLGQIDASHGGTLVINPIEAPDAGAVIEQLDTDDLFTLIAVMQHGSLTAEEHAVVFQWASAASRAQLDDLLSRELIEPDPGRPGWRVRPGALRVVRDALHRRNLA